MASEAIDRITKLAERLEVEGNLAGAVLLYRQAISLTPIVGDLVQELRLRSILHRLEEQVALLDQDITGATTVAWAQAKERAAKAEGAGQGARATTSQAAGRQRTAVDELFELGLAAFWKGDLLHARNVLAEVVSQDPKYRTEQHRAVNLLAGIERRLALPPAPEQAQPGSARLHEAKDSARTGGTLRLLLAVAFPAVALLLVLLFAAFPVAAPQAQEPHPAPTARVAEALPSTSGLAEAAPADALAAFVGANGGAARFGRALSPLMTEVTTGVTQTVAYYEYAILAYTGEALAGDRVSILPVGKLELERRYPQSVPAGIAPSGDQLYFEQTGFALWDSFRTNWEQPGNAAVFGQPVSGVFTETVEGAGPRIVQYFEYGAMRAAADQPGGTVLRGPLGSERFQALYGKQ